MLFSGNPGASQPALGLFTRPVDHGIDATIHQALDNHVTVGTAVEDLRRKGEKSDLNSRLLLLEFLACHPDEYLWRPVWSGSCMGSISLGKSGVGWRRLPSSKGEPVRIGSCTDGGRPMVWPTSCRQNSLGGLRPPVVDDSYCETRWLEETTRTGPLRRMRTETDHAVGACLRRRSGLVIDPERKESAAVGLSSGSDPNHVMRSQPLV